jgi:competence protein ComEC
MPVAAVLAVPAAAQLTCAPIVVMLAGQVSLVAIPANLLVGPAVAPATLLGVVAALCAPVAPALAAVVARLAAVPAGWIVAVAERAAQVPHASVGWPDGLPGALALPARPGRPRSCCGA